MPDPRFNGFPETALELHKGLYASHDWPLTREVHRAGPIDYCMNVFVAGAPLHRWLFDVLAS